MPLNKETKTKCASISVIDLADKLVMSSIFT